MCSRAPLLHGRCPVSTLLRTQPPPSRLRPFSRGLRLCGLPCSVDFSTGRGRLLQLLGMSLSPCCPYHPANRTEGCASSKKRQDFSAFALTYILRLSSCRVMGDFVISPLPACQQGPFAGVAPFQRYYGPSRQMRSTLLRRFPTGRGRLLQLLGMSLSPCCPYHPARGMCFITIGGPGPQRPSFLVSDEGNRMCRQTIWFTCCYGPVTRSPSSRWLCQSASSVSFPPRT